MYVYIYIGKFIFNYFCNILEYVFAQEFVCTCDLNWISQSNIAIAGRGLLS
jgi:hypothetical protein